MSIAVGISHYTYNDIRYIVIQFNVTKQFYTNNILPNLFRMLLSICINIKYNLF